MSNLSGKAKEEFEKWFDNEYSELSCEYQGEFNMPITSYNALIIDFFDSVEIFISINYDSFSGGFECKIKADFFNFCSGIHERAEATTKAIEKANEIYNNLNQ